MLIMQWRYINYNESGTNYDRFLNYYLPNMFKSLTYYRQYAKIMLNTRGKIGINSV